jgi:hypothetical protein
MVFDWMPVRGILKYKFELMKNDGTIALTKEADFNSVVVENANTLLFKDKTYTWKVTPIEKADGTPDINGVVNSFCIKEPKKENSSK